MNENQFAITLQWILTYPPCIRAESCHFIDKANDRVREAFKIMVSKDFSLYRKIRQLEDHEGSLTVTLYEHVSFQQQDIMRWAWESIGEDERHVEFEMFKSK